jgi:hypothetical protein
MQFNALQGVFACCLWLQFSIFGDERLDENGGDWTIRWLPPSGVTHTLFNVVVRQAV